MGFELVILDGAQAGRRLPLGSVPITFGRSPAAQLSFPGDNFMSGNHLSAQASEQGVLLTDNRSTNGTFLNGQRIAQSIARPGDIIKIGSLSMQVGLAQEQAPPPHAFTPPPPLPGSAYLPPTVREMNAPLPPMNIPAPPPFPVPAPPAFQAPPPPAAFEPAPTALEPASPAASDPFSPYDPGPPSGATTVLPKFDVAAFAPPPPPVSVAPVEGALRLLRESNGPLFALVNPSADPAVSSVLREAGADATGCCLMDGDSFAPPPTWSPYLLPLTLDGPVLRHFLDDGWGKGWACFFTSPATYDQLREHFRRFLLVQTQNGGEPYFRFWEPGVLRGFLRTGAPNELAMFFGPISEWVVEGDTRDTMLRSRNSPGGVESSTISAS